MKKIISIALALVLVSILSLSAFAEAEKTIAVKGKGDVTLVADTATLSLGIRTKKADVKTAYEENKAGIQRLIKALTDMGIAKEDIATENFNIYYYDGGNYENEGYEVSNSLSVIVKDIEKISLVMEAAYQAGSNMVYGAQFSSSKSDEAYVRAMELAIKNAREKAEKLAAMSGKKLGGILSVGESDSYNIPFSDKNNMEMMKGNAGDMLLVGDLSVRANIDVVFALLDE